MTVSNLRAMMSSPVARDRVFEHRLLPRIKISSEDTPTGRFYSTPDGNRYPSVTTVLGKLSKQGLDDWRRRVGEEVAEQVRQQAATRGTAVHELCEAYVRNEDVGVNAMPSNLYTFRQIQKVLRERLGTVYGVEYPLYSEYLGTAGRTDVIAEFDGVKSIVDFKTSLKKKPEEYVLSYFLQATAYGMMVEERNPGFVVPQVAVIIAVDHEQPHVYVKQKNDYISMVKEVFRDGHEKA